MLTLPRARALFGSSTLFHAQLRAVTAFFTARCGIGGARRAFKRLQRITAVLNVGEIEEVHEIMYLQHQEQTNRGYEEKKRTGAGSTKNGTAGGAGSRKPARAMLTPAQVRRVLGLRVDFAHADVQAVVLR